MCSILPKHAKFTWYSFSDQHHDSSSSSSDSSSSFDPCDEPVALGCEDGRLPNSSFSAKGQYRRNDRWVPAHARLNGPTGWASRRMLALNIRDTTIYWRRRLLRKHIHLQVDFGKNVLVSAVATQGSGTTLEGSLRWVTSYQLEYSTIGGRGVFQKVLSVDPARHGKPEVSRCQCSELFFCLFSFLWCFDLRLMIADQSACASSSSGSASGSQDF